MRPELDVLELLLGEGTEEQRNRLRGRVAEDPALAIGLAETADLLESCRSLTVEPTGRVEQMMAIRARLHQRQASRRPHDLRVLPLWGRLVGIVTVAAVALGSLLLLPDVRPSAGALERELAASPWAPTASELPRGSGPVQAPGIPDSHPGDAPLGSRFSNPGSTEPGVGLEPTRRILPVEAPRFQTAFGRFSSLTLPDAFDAVVSARDDLELLRVEFYNRSTPQQRRHAIAASGGNPDVDDRVQDLAVEVARKINRQLDRHEADVLETSLALRALFASGSDTDVGRHRNTVRRCAGWLEARLQDLSGGELASALTALSDLAVRDGRMGIVVREHTARLAWETITRPDVQGKDHRRQRPSLLSWDVPAASLGDAGRLFRLAQAFGVAPELAFEARRMVLTHLEERLETSEHPSSLAAQLYGFGDLVGRSDLDRRLKPWRPVNLDPVTVYHLAWSRFPVRRGWAQFQKHLRQLSALPTPHRAGDAGALLLCLAMNFAAPGSAEMLLSQE